MGRGADVTVGAMIDARRLIVCVGTGGVGKTTIAAAIALGAARRGRRAMVLTIDPARALARALGLAALAPGGQAVPGVPGLDAAMLDQQQAWDAFVRRHAPTPAHARDLLDNRFYRELSTSFSGSTEYMAIEETCRLAESGRHDLIVLDTPPAANTLDFLRAPERLDRLLSRRTVDWLTRPAAGLARFVLRQIERATGAQALRDVSAFLTALDALVDDVAARTRRARALLHGGEAAFVLVAGPRQLVLAETAALAARMRALAAPLEAVVLNRVHARPRTVDVGAALAAIEDEAARTWVGAAWDDAIAEADSETEHVRGFAASLPADLAHAAIPEAAHDLHAIADLEAIADQLWSAVPGPQLA